MYAIIPQQIPRDKRAEVNEKILFAIDSGKDLIPKESIYNCYTGIGGLHNLKQADFSSYHRYAEAKKEFEMGQFFTPHELCRSMVEVLSPTSSEMVLDMCCGMGNFFNHLPNLHNTYGFDIDGRAVTSGTWTSHSGTVLPRTMPGRSNSTRTDASTYGSKTVRLPKTVTDGSVWTKSRSMKIDS